eukprot:2065498-Rhodomonas_salina.1
MYNVAASSRLRPARGSASHSTQHTSQRRVRACPQACKRTGHGTRSQIRPKQPRSWRSLYTH